MDEEIFEVSISNSNLSVESSEKVSGKISIADADIVVSAGRGMTLMRFEGSVSA